MEAFIPYALGIAILTLGVLYTRKAQEAAAAVAQRGQLEEAKAERDAARLEVKALERQLAEAGKQMELVTQREDAIRQQMRDWQKLQEEMKKSTQAAVLETSKTLSSKLLEDYERKAEEERKKRESELHRHQEDYLKRFNEMVESFAAVKKDAHGTREKMELVMRSLTNPGGAGRMSEVGLENALKNLGLERGRDYVVQPHMTGEGGAALRPDAMIFLPQDMVMVIDSKASKSILELAAAEGTPEQSHVEARLVKTMNDHLKALISRDYKSAVERMYKESARGGKIGRIFNVMYVHSDGGLEKLRTLDPEFDIKLMKADIFPASSVTLYGLFSLAKQSIAEARQAENAEKITEAVAGLMEGIVTAFGHYDKVGRTLKTAVESFSAFGKSVNHSVIGRMHRLNTLGVEPAKNKSVPARLSTYDIHRADDTLTLEAGDAEDEKIIPRLNRYRL